MSENTRIAPPAVAARPAAAADLSVQIGPVRFANPWFAASGCLDMGSSTRASSTERSGAVVTKTITLEPRQGNRPTPARDAVGLLNSIGLQTSGSRSISVTSCPSWWRPVELPS